MIEREIKKGSAPLTFDHIDYRADAIHEIESESELKRVLVYLFRIAEYENLANDMTRNGRSGTEVIRDVYQDCDRKTRSIS